MHLNELFDAPAPLTRMLDYEIEEAGLHDVVTAWKFTTNNIRFIVFFINPYMKPNMYSCGFVFFHNHPTKQNTVNSFSFANRPVSYEAPPGIQKNAYPVLSTVIHAIRLFIHEYKPYSIAMNGTDSGRKRLYNVVATKMASALPDGYAFSRHQSGDLFLVKTDISPDEMTEEINLSENSSESGCWVTSEGKILEAEHGNHSYVAGDHFDGGPFAENVITQALSAGWIRVSIWNSISCGVDYNPRIANKLAFRALWRYLNQLPDFTDYHFDVGTRVQGALKRFDTKRKALQFVGSLSSGTNKITEDEFADASSKQNSIAESLFQKYGKQVPFNALSPEDKKAVRYYMVVDGENDDYKTNRQYGVADIPTEVLLKATHENFQAVDPDIEPFDSYTKFYTERKPDTKHKTVWPVLIGQEVLEDGWHRFHQYVHQGLKKIPCVFFLGSID